MSIEESENYSVCQLSGKSGLTCMPFCVYLGMENNNKINKRNKHGKNYGY